MEEREEEVWKDILGFENWYQISSYGRIKRKAYQVIYRCGEEEYVRANKPEEIKQAKNLTVVLQYKDYFLHRQRHSLVADHFLDNPKFRCFVAFKDGDKTNLYYKNLVWADRGRDVSKIHRQGREEREKKNNGRVERCDSAPETE